MESDGRGRPGANRSGSHRSQKSDWRGTNQSPVKTSSTPNANYSSSDEDSSEPRNREGGRGFRSAHFTKTGDRGGVTGRARVTPSDLVVTSTNLDPSAYDGKENGHHLQIDVSMNPSQVHHIVGNQQTVMSQHSPSHYYQDPSLGDYRGGNCLNQYESPVFKGSRNHGMGGRRLGPPMQGSSMSSSDNNSDTTYAESDINNSLRARMNALDHEFPGTPPDPAPPEVPPRGPSHHHPLLASRGGQHPSLNPSSPHYQDRVSEEGYQEPATNVFLSQGLRSPRFRVKNGQIPERFLGTSADECEYLMSGTSPRYVGSMGGKSPMGQSMFGPSPTRDYINDISQTSRIMTTIGSQKDLGVLNSTGGGVMGSPSTMNNLAMGGARPSFSSRKLHLGKTWNERLSWRCTCVILLVFSAILIALLTFFAASYATVDIRSKGCIVVEDAAKVIAADTQSDTTTNFPTSAYTVPVSTANINKVPQMEAKASGTELTRLQILNRRYSNTISPQGYWNIQFLVKQPMFIRFNLIVPRSSQLGFYGRRNVAPSITQYDFVEFLRSGRIGRPKRSLVKLKNDDELPYEKTIGPNSKRSAWFDDWLESDYYSEQSDQWRMDALFDFAPKHSRSYRFDQETSKDFLEDETINRSKRYLNEKEVNVSLVEYLDTGIWYISLYNDGLALNQVSVLLQEAPELQSACSNDCSGHGSCVLGHCECVQGWIGEDCSKSVCPILCSGHGSYGGGICHCNKGWKGQECDVPLSDCEVPDCRGQGTCVSGTCICHVGWRGEHCDQVDCKDPTCGGNGWCVDGICVCRAGWKGDNCTQVDEKVFTCLPDCSGNGQYDLHTSICLCNDFWSGPDCSVPRCNLDCIHGVCDGNICKCEEGWTGTRCHERDCDYRCALHGQCNNGTCICGQGWNGKHCTIPGCTNSCSGNGVCVTERGSYKCSCSKGWMGSDCSVALETHCNDEADNDGDGLVDCNDSECCSTSVCRDHVMCIMSSDPVEVLLRKQPPAVTASFYQRVKFIIEDKNVQSFARIDEFVERRVSVIRGQVVTPQGQGIVGVRTSIEKKSKYGLTATRKDGWFDVLVNGGGAVTLQFQRAHFEPMTLTVPVLWNQIVVLNPVVMRHKDQILEDSLEDPELKWADPCTEHDHELMRPQIISTSLPHTIGSVPESSVIFTESQMVQESFRIPDTNLHLIYQSSHVSGYRSTLLLQLTPNDVPKSLSLIHLKVTLEGVTFEKVFEGDPNLNYTFTWNKRNTYKQKVYGEATALVAVGFEYSSCNKIVWETQTAQLLGYHMDISDVGGWNLDIHHMFNFESGLLQRGDGSTLNLRDTPRLVDVLMGTGTQRTLSCKMCSGVAEEAKLLTPSALASGPDGSVYVGDFNLIRRVNTDGIVTTVLQLSATQVSHGYYMTVSPADGRVYVSDPEKYRVIRLLAMENVTDPTNNYEVVAGNGDRCIPGDERHCGDRGLALKARLSHPKGLTIASDKTMYIADGTNIRMVDPMGVIHTLIGHHGHKAKWRPLPCSGGIPANQVELQWPTGLALSTLDGSLHILDDHVVLQVTNDGSVRVRAGNPLHCKSTEEHSPVGTITSLAFSPSGSLYVTEQTANKHHYIREIKPSSEVTRFAGASPEECGCTNNEDCTCPNEKITLATNILLGPVSAVTVTPDGVIHIADQKALQILSFKHYLPDDDQNGDYLVAYPNTNELYLFNRHGHHLETRDMTTGRKMYSFLYSKNTSFGRLSKVTDSQGNKIVFLRDYKAAVSQIENTEGEKFNVEISRLGLMTRFSERLDRHYDFAYDDDTGLLLSSITPGSMTTIYEYDESGRLKTMTSPVGSRIGFQSWIDGPNSKKYLAVGVKQLLPNVRSENDNQYVLAMMNENSASLIQGSISSKLETFSNGTWVQSFPWGGSVTAAATTSSNPLLEPYLPTQARLLPFTSRYSLTPGVGEVPNVLITSFGILADRHLPERLVEKVILVNGTRVLSHQWGGSDQTDTITDSERNQLLQIAYNANGRPISIVLGSNFTSQNMSYDRFGHIRNRQWDRASEEYDYNPLGLLTSVKSKSVEKINYSFGEDRLLSVITLPSGRTWTYHYDRQGGLSFIESPSGSSHKFSVQPSFGFYIFTYTPPGTSHGYRQHLDEAGRLLLTVFPTGVSKILYTYTKAGQLENIVSGDGKTHLIYGDSSLVSEIIHEEFDVEYKIDFDYKGFLIKEQRIDYGARTAFGNVKFTYEYDSNFRTTNLGGRIGGQNLQDLSYQYEGISGSLNVIGPFKISRPSFNETVIHDGTAIFSRRVNSQFKVIRTSVTIHKMEVFRMDFTYNRDGNIAQTNTYTRNFHSKPYTNTKNYTYDDDGQLVSVEAKEPWNFSYDSFGNMLSLTYSTNTIPMKYDSQDRIIKFGEGGYKYDSRGAIVQNVREVNYQYNARGMLVRASKNGRFDIKYMYDHEGRLVARKDNFGNVTQFMYGDQQNTDQVTHIYNPRDGNLISLVYDDRGHVIFAQMYRNKYYIATDECGTPIMVFNQYGEVVREIMRSPYGHIIYDSNPYLYLPIDYCGGILETRTELVHLPKGKIYDPLIGLFLTPAWMDIPGNLLNPIKLSLYRFNGNDPINVADSNWRNSDYRDWLKHLNFHTERIAPQLYAKDVISPILNQNEPVSVLEAYSRISAKSPKSNVSPFTNQVRKTERVSGFWNHHQESLKYVSRLSTVQPSTLIKEFWPDDHKFELSTSVGPFGKGILMSLVEDRAIVVATPQANPIFKDVLTSVFNNSFLVDVSLMSHNTYVFYFVKEDFWKATEDMTQLNRLAGEVNISMHEPSLASSSTDDLKGDKVVEVKLHSSAAIIHIRYGTIVEQEKKRLQKHAKKVATRQAWSEERELLAIGLPGSIPWSSSESEELISQGSVGGYSARYLHSPDRYPALVDDPSNIRFYKIPKRTRRNLKTKQLKKCRLRKREHWWRVINC